MKIQKRFFLLAALLAMCLLAGCGSGKKNEASQKETAAAKESAVPSEQAPLESEETLKSIGNVYAVEITNMTQKGITGISIKTGSEAEYPENMLAQGDTFTAGETRVLYCVRTQEDVAMEKAGAVQTASPAADQKLPAVAYDVQVTYEDGTVHVLHGFPFGNVAKAQLYTENNVSYITYTDMNTKQSVSTKEAETAAAASAQAAQQEAQEEAARQAAEAQQAAEDQKEAAQLQQAEAAAEAEAARQAEAEAEAQRQAEAAAEAEAEAQRQAEAAAEAEAEAQRQAEAAAQEAEQQESEECIGDEGLLY